MFFLPPHESVTTEFKREWTDNIKKEIVAFANTLGGDLFIGVDDDGELVGVDNPDRLEERIISMARDNIHPAVTHLLWFERIRRDGKTALVVHVGPGTDKPYCTDPRDSGTVYVRRFRHPACIHYADQTICGGIQSDPLGQSDCS